MNLENTVIRAAKTLKNHNINSYGLDAELILSHIMGVKREYLIMNKEKTISNEIIKKYDKAIKRRIKNEPVAYIIGRREFWSEDFIINNKTLVPRPETELLIYKVVDFFKGKKIKILDIGTGSGCILLSILKELPFAKGTGIDISPEAVKVAKINSQNLNLISRSKFKVCNLEEYRVGKYDLIVSNPPYILTKDINKLSKDITNYEPRIALDGGVDGLDLIKKVIYKSNHLLKKSGLLALEIGYYQYSRVSSILRYNKYEIIKKEHDYKQNVRCIISTKLNYIK